jgi:hypothetical protein
LALALLVGPTASAEPVTTELAPAADNWVNSCPSGNVDKNGASEQLRLRGWSNGPRAFRTLAQFDLSTLAGKTIQSATLGIYWYGGSNNAPTVQRTAELYEQVDEWAETNSNWRFADDLETDPPSIEWTSVDTWNASQPYYSGPSGTQGGGGTAGDLIDSYTLQWTGSSWGEFTGEWLEFDVTDMVQAWVDGDPNNGFLMMMQDEISSANTVYFMYSRECTACDPSEMPFLEVTYEEGPEPWGAPATAEAATLGASRSSGSFNYLLMVLLPAAVVVGIKRMRKQTAE